MELVYQKPISLKIDGVTRQERHFIGINVQFVQKGYLQVFNADIRGRNYSGYSPQLLYSRALFLKNLLSTYLSQFFKKQLSTQLRNSHFLQKV